MVGDVTERSVMAVGLLPSPLLGVSSLDLAPFAAAGGPFFHALVVSERERRYTDGRCPRLVMPGLDPGIHRNEGLRSKRWIAGSSPAMTAAGTTKKEARRLWAG